MEKIIKMFGQVFIIGAVTVLAFAIGINMRDDEGNIGVFNIIGAHLPSMQERSGLEYDTYQQEAGKECPTVRYVSLNALEVGTYDLRDLINAQDNEGNSISYTLTGVTSPNGTEWTQTEEMTQITFNDPGIYTLEIMAKDSGNRLTRGIVRVPVNPRTIEYEIL